MDSEPTPGTWQVRSKETANYYPELSVWAGDTRICVVEGDTQEEVKANAALIKSAKDLLQRLEWISARWELEQEGAIFPCAAMRDSVLRLIAEANGGAA